VIILKIPATKAYFNTEDKRFILQKFDEILDGESFLAQHKYCEEFERLFSEYTGSKFGATTNSGTSALEVIFRSLGCKGYDVIVPTNTFAATAFAVIHAGGRPIFADCSTDLTVDPEDVKRKITKNTKAIVTVHIGGLVSPQTEELKELCEEKDIYFVEDAAHAHGSMLNNQKAGTFGIAGAFSFFSTKVMTSGEGGMIVTDNENLYNKAKILRDQAKIKKGNYQNYHEDLGYNWRMTEVQALMGITQLKNLENFIARRNELAKIYDEELSDLQNLTILERPANVRHNYYKYIAFLSGVNRDKLHEGLKVRGINMGGYVYEIPLHLLPVFEEFSHRRLPVAEDLCSRHICPPIYYTLSDDEAMYVGKSIKEYLK
jgi:perosamine synthetase